MKHFIFRFFRFIGLLAEKISEYIYLICLLISHPDELIKLNKIKYSKETDAWCEEKVVLSGLSMEEENIIKKWIPKASKILILGCGGGRECIALVKKGYQVIGMDFIEPIIKKAKKLTGKIGLEINYLVAEMSKVNFAPNSFDAVLLLRLMYCSIPTKELRVKMLGQIYEILKPEGIFIFDFRTGNFTKRQIYLINFIKKITNIFGQGKEYQFGDQLLRGREFTHTFYNLKDLLDEIEETNFKILGFNFGPNLPNFAVLQRPQQDG